MYPTFEQFATFMDKVAREACDPVYGFDAFKITSKRVSVNLVTEYSSMKDDFVSSCISPKLGQIEERMSDVSYMQVNHVMMDEPSDRVDKLCNIERQDETVCLWSVEDKQVHDMRLTETGPMLKEPGVWLSENGPMLKEPGVMLRETGPVLKEPGVRLSVGVELSDSDVKKVVCNILVVEED